MIDLRVGDDVIVDFEGWDHLGHIERIDRGWARCSILIDPELDYGPRSASFAPLQTVMVPIGRVRLRD